MDAVTLLPVLARAKDRSRAYIPPPEGRPDNRYNSLRVEELRAGHNRKPGAAARGKRARSRRIRRRTHRVLAALTALGRGS